MLDAPEALSIVCISVTTKGAGPGSAAAWLPVAARRLSGDLVYHNIADPMNEDDDDGEEEEAVGRGDDQLPCFEKATSIELNIGFLGLALPSLGVFARLTKLSLMRVDFHGPCELGSAVSSPRCPFLEKLEVCNSRGLHNLSIHSESLLQIVLKNLGSLRELTIVAPTLEKLEVKHSLYEDDESEPVANSSALQLVYLTWRDVYDPESVHLGNLGRLQRLTANFFYVYGLQGENQSCLSLLQRFKVLDSLRLPLVWQDINDFQYLMGDMAKLPQIRFLHLSVFNQGHAFGASLFHVLRICTGLRKLSIVLYSSSSLENIGNFQYAMEELTKLPCLASLAILLRRNGHTFGASLFHVLRMRSDIRKLVLLLLDLEEPFVCPSGCVCDHSTDWKTEELTLNCLQEVAIDMEGTDHEVAFVKQLFTWAVVLKRMQITFDPSISECKVRELRQTLSSFSRPETQVEFYMYHTSGHMKFDRRRYLLGP